MTEYPLVCAFTVHGVAIPQGSKRVVPTAGGPRAIESNERKLRPWRAQVAAEAALAMDGNPIETGALQLRVRFVFPRPKSHFGTGSRADVLKPTAPEYVSTKPDCDKLLRALFDALTGICFRDDSQIAHVNAWKEYGQAARMDVEVRELERRIVEVAA